MYLLKHWSMNLRCYPQRTVFKELKSHNDECVDACLGTQLMSTGWMNEQMNERMTNSQLNLIQGFASDWTFSSYLYPLYHGFKNLLILVHLDILVILNLVNLLLLLLLLNRFSRVRLCVTPETAAHQASPSLGFSRQEHWNGNSGLPFHSPLVNLVVKQI